MPIVDTITELTAIRYRETKHEEYLLELKNKREDRNVERLNKFHEEVIESAITKLNELGVIVEPHAHYNGFYNYNRFYDVYFHETEKAGNGVHRSTYRSLRVIVDIEPVLCINLMYEDSCFKDVKFEEAMDIDYTVEEVLAVIDKAFRRVIRGIG